MDGFIDLEGENEMFNKAIEDYFQVSLFYFSVLLLLPLVNYL